MHMGEKSQSKFVKVGVPTGWMILKQDLEGIFWIYVGKRCEQCG